MKQVLIFLLSLTFPFVVEGQSINIDSCGLDNKSILTKWEIEYFKENIETLKTMDLENKKIAFAHGNYGTQRLVKMTILKNGVETIIIEIVE